jgi:hypothetical protein
MNNHTIDSFDSLNKEVMSTMEVADEFKDITDVNVLKQKLVEVKSKLEQVSGLVSSTLRENQALKIALQENRGDWHSPDSIFVWTEDYIREYSELNHRIDRTDENSERFLKHRIIYSHSALNQLKHLAEACDLLNVQGFLVPGQIEYILKENHHLREAAKNLKEMNEKLMNEMNKTTV